LTTLLLTRGPDPRVVQVRRCGVCARLLARTRAVAIDRALAGGASPDSTVTLSLRAHSLISSGHRVDLARRLRWLLEAAARRVHPFEPALQVPSHVLSVRELIDDIVDVLEGPEPIDARGAARLEVLLRDGGGPIYDDAGSRALRQVLEQSLEALRVSPPIPADA
jgi:hypothetical protein